MTTRTKLYITGYTVSAMLLLNVFSKPLHIPETFQWVLIIGGFIPLGLMFYLIKKQKMEKQAAVISAEAAVLPATGQQQGARRKLILIMAFCSAVGLCSPLWLPLTGTTLGTRGDFICGIITAVIVCTICGLKLRKL